MMHCLMDKIQQESCLFVKLGAIGRLSSEIISDAINDADIVCHRSSPRAGNTAEGEGAKENFTAHHLLSSLFHGSIS